MIQRTLLGTRYILFYSNRSYVRGVRGRRRDPAALSASVPVDDPSHFDIFENDPSDLSSQEADFNALPKSYNRYKQETREHRDTIRHQMVGQKYFKNENLNFLTWAEKEQIRLLHSQNPEEWSVERLSDSFPADVSAISKIIKSNWQPKNKQRIEKHDANVWKNWNRFQSKQIKNLDPAIAAHLNKFSARDLNIKTIATVESAELSEIRNARKPLHSEFSKIITSCKAYKNKETTFFETNGETKLKISKIPTKDGTHLLGKIEDRTPVTMKHLIDSDTKDFVNADAKVIKMNSKESDIVDLTVPHPETLKIKKFDTTEVRPEEEALKQLSVPSIRETITIPRRLFKEGATYKLDDCFYDDDGEFLYRVPGLTGQKR